ncbi:hypothetical protein J3459_016942 [Metarhizium acridum]|nr:hypothetical protein J3459_016942 [Metarhizium acridum]
MISRRQPFNNKPDSLRAHLEYAKHPSPIYWAPKSASPFHHMKSSQTKQPENTTATDSVGTGGVSISCESSAPALSFEPHCPTPSLAQSVDFYNKVSPVGSGTKVNRT